MEELYQIRRDLITMEMELLLPSVVKAKKPLRFWLDNKIAKEEELEIVKP